MAENRSFEGELTKAISGSLIVGRVVVMAVAIAIASVALYAFNALALIKVGKVQWLFFLNYAIAGIGWVLGALFVLSGMVSVCKMASARESGQSSNIFSGVLGIFSNLFVVFFATIRYLFWFVALLIVIWGLSFFGRIPEAGPILTGIALGIVTLGVTLWLVLHVAKFFGAALVLPGIIAGSGQKGVVCFKEAKRIVNGQPISLIKRFLAVGLAIVLFSFLVTEGVGFFVNHAGRAIGETNSPVLNGAPPIKKLPVVPSYGSPPLVPKGQQAGQQDQGAQDMPAAFQGMLGRLQSAAEAGAAHAYGLPVVGGIQMGGGIGQSKATGTRLAGAWFFGIEFLLVLLVLKAIALNFFALAGMSTYQALKDEPASSITAPDIKIDLAKMKGSLGAVGAKFKEEMKEEGSAAPKKSSKKSEEGG